MRVFTKTGITTAYTIPVGAKYISITNRHATAAASWTGDYPNSQAETIKAGEIYVLPVTKGEYKNIVVDGTGSDLEIVAGYGN